MFNYINFKKDYTFKCFSNEKTDICVKINSKQYEDALSVIEYGSYSLYYNVNLDDYCITRPPYPTCEWDGEKFVNTDPNADASYFFEDKLTWTINKTERDLKELEIILTDFDSFAHNGKYLVSKTWLNKEESEAFLQYLKSSLSLFKEYRNEDDFNNLKEVYRHKVDPYRKTNVECKEKEFVNFYIAFWDSMKNSCLRFEKLRVEHLDTNGIHFGVIDKKIDNKERYELNSFYKEISNNKLFTPIVVDSKVDQRYKVLEGNHRVCAMIAKKHLLTVPCVFARDFSNDKDLNLEIPAKLFNDMKENPIIQLSIKTKSKNVIKCSYTVSMIKAYGEKMFIRDLLKVLSKYIDKGIKKFELKKEINKNV
ncbi:MAG: ParB N-terminal domain-containing protein [Fusobacteriaceae bacterium]